MVLEQAEVLARNVGPHEGGAQQADEADGRLRCPQLIGDALGALGDTASSDISEGRCRPPPAASALVVKSREIGSVTHSSASE